MAAGHKRAHMETYIHRFTGAANNIFTRKSVSAYSKFFDDLMRGLFEGASKKNL